MWRISGARRGLAAGLGPGAGLGSGAGLGLGAGLGSGAGPGDPDASRVWSARRCRAGTLRDTAAVVVETTAARRAPIGQAAGRMYDRATRSRNIWKEIAPRAGFWHETAGSLHLAYHPDEWQVLQELHEVFRKEGRPVQLMNPCS